MSNSSTSQRALGLSRSVWLLGWVSLATDAATEAIYPLLPLFLTTVLGAGAVSLGLIEGAAEATNSILKILSGRWADRSRSKRPLVLIGYTISSLTRPLIALATNWTQVFAIRVGDRVGKGIRGAPRDAMLASLATPATRGRVYGFHRAMDHTGAVVGPLAATLFLFFYPGQYRTLFGLAIIPGAIAVALIFLVREEEGAATAWTGKAGGPGRAGREDRVGEAGTGRPGRAGRAGEAGQSKDATGMLPAPLKTFFVILAIFMLGNSTDAFLLLKLTEAAGSATYIPLMWSALHVVKASVSFVGGSWSDRVGRSTVIVIGWLVYAVVYVGFAVSSSIVVLLAWFMIYGFYFGLTEGTEKALVADLAPPERRGFAFGVFTAVQGLGSLAASLLFGAVWTAYGSAAAFGLGSALALVASVLFFMFQPARASM